MLKPIFTEKSLQLAKNGKYSFFVDSSATKADLKSEIGKLFGVHVVEIKTIVTPGENKRNARGRKVTVLTGKKAIVTLKDKEKIDVFEQSKK